MSDELEECPRCKKNARAKFNIQGSEFFRDTNEHIIFTCAICGLEWTPQSAEVIVALRARVEKPEAERDQAKSMVERLIKTGQYAMALLEIRKSSIHDHEITDLWDALVAEWRGEK